MDVSPVADAASHAFSHPEGIATLDSSSADAELLAAMPQGLGALEILYDRYRTMAYSVAVRVTNDPSLAEDVVQEAFLGVWRHAVRYRADRGSVKTWLMSIVHHRAIDAVRRRRPVTELPPIELEPPARFRVPDVWEAVSAELDAVEVRRAMSALSQVQRQAIELAYFGGLTQQEIADRTRTPLGTVKSRVRLGLLAMRSALVADPANHVTMRSSGFGERSPLLVDVGVEPDAIKGVTTTISVTAISVTGASPAP